LPKPIKNNRFHTITFQKNLNRYGLPDNFIPEAIFWLDKGWDFADAAILESPKNISFHSWIIILRKK